MLSINYHCCAYPDCLYLTQIHFFECICIYNIYLNYVPIWLRTLFQDCVEIILTWSQACQFTIGRLTLVPTYLDYCYRSIIYVVYSQIMSVSTCYYQGFVKQPFMLIPKNIFLLNIIICLHIMQCTFSRYLRGSFPIANCFDFAAFGLCSHETTSMHRPVLKTYFLIGPNAVSLLYDQRRHIAY